MDQSIANPVLSFIDLEVNPSTKQVLDYGGAKFYGFQNTTHVPFHSGHLSEFVEFISDSQFVCGHNVFKHDLKFLKESAPRELLIRFEYIDTLLFSPLLFPARPYHRLIKDDKLNPEELSNPLSDSLTAADLFFDEVDAFKALDPGLRVIYYELLSRLDEWKGFFSFLKYNGVYDKTTLGHYSDVETLIRQRFKDEICGNCSLAGIISKNPIELAYCLALINARDRYSITPPWVLKSYPGVERVMYLLRNNPCITGCQFCNDSLDIHKGLYRFFGFKAFRKYANEPLQEKAVKAAVDGKSILAVFPTGGGKSLTFQLPALMSGESVKGLTVVISPLQSLMKDQVDNLEKASITEAVTINGLLDPIERAKSIERIADGSASLLYIAPESLRSKTIEHILLGRKIVRFVVDEAHCFSSWGQDFRVDYLYIADFIKSLQKNKNLQDPIPVSCFTATAKQKVVDDIRLYFKDKLNLELDIYTSKASRTNLTYQVFERGNEEEKYNAVRNLLDEEETPAIIYVSRTRKAYLLAERLTKDGYSAKPYHGKMDPKEKTENQNAFIAGDVRIMVATSAFGMGVDKKDVGMVIHFEISDSLENYVQEAGRAGRDESITAKCYVLFNEDDLDKHFILLNQTKLNIKEIQQVWRAIKDITRLRSRASNSALEIARQAGWDDNIADIETRVTTAIAALEDAGYLKRGQNSPRIFANSILSKTAQEAIEKIHASARFNEKDKVLADRIIKNLIASRARKQARDDAAESRVDYIADNLGVVKGEIIRIINLLREEKILADNKDLTAYIRRGDNKNQSIRVTETFLQLEKFLLLYLDPEEKIIHLKEINEKALQEEITDTTPNKLKTILNFWAIKNWIKRKTTDFQNNRICIQGILSRSEALEKQAKRHELARFIIDFLYDRSFEDEDANQQDEVLIQFSVNELKDAFNNRNVLFSADIDISDVEDALFYLSRINALKIDGGFLVVYNKLTIERLESNLRKQYKTEDYQKLAQFYENKVQQIHIVGEYAKKMITDYQNALQFVEDYFRLNYQSFLNKYFNVKEQTEIRQNITQAKFRKLFGELSPTQLKVINEQNANYMVVAAGPGSGKTKLLVHKLASLIFMEDVKFEQLLMLTFSRAAATEFKKRLMALVGNAASFVQIMTFHSYCFDLLGKIGTLEQSDAIIKDAIEKIRSRDIERSLITKTVLVIDEAQDMSAEEYELVKALMEMNEGMRVIAVGDDDQNIYEFRGSSSQYLYDFIKEKQAVVHELLTNYRSRNNLVLFTNEFAENIKNRLKKNPIQAASSENGTIKITTYLGENLIFPLVKEILQTELSGTTGILTRTNEEALQVTGLLLKNKIKARLIQSNEGFNLYNLNEVRYFLDKLFFDETSDSRVISEETWEEAKRQFFIDNNSSTDLDICRKLIKDFETINPKKKYKSDLEIFIKESKLEDFISGNGETMLVSTMHKAKGREFDNVFLMLSNQTLYNEQDKRLLYVAMTRAKENLYIYFNKKKNNNSSESFANNNSITNNSIITNNNTITNNNSTANNYSIAKNSKTEVFDQSLSTALLSIQAPHLTLTNDTTQWDYPNELVMQLGLKDVWLDYFAGKQYPINRLKSGDVLTIKDTECLDKNGKSILKFSKSFIEEIEKLKTQGYTLTKCLVNHIIYWKKEGTDNEIKIVLPEVWFEKS